MEKNYTEAQLEGKLLTELSQNGYEWITINDENDLLNNFKTQLEKLNDFKISDASFEKILNEMNYGNVFQKAKKLRDKCEIEENGIKKNIILLNTNDWCKNIFQVSNQITIKGKRENRYDVTILFNGIPVVQIELKRPGVDIKQSFNQCIRYKHESMAKSLFDYVQIFVISNGNITKYFANQNKFNENSYAQVVEYADFDNKKVHNLSEFRFYFLERCQLSKLITQYMILKDGDEKNYGTLVLMRPYQVHAVEAIINKIESSVGHGYVWHTTGSGKTLTSFKTAQIISQMKNIDKVLFIVDRSDLDAQTTSEFNQFGQYIAYDDIVKEYKNTRELIKDLKSEQKMMVTTIQKMDHAIRRMPKDDELQNKKIVLIFDECHRSQKGDMHKRIETYFNNIQKIGFTGTPIFAENSEDLKTTSQIFGKEDAYIEPGEKDPHCLHSYILPNAINDHKVLGFSVEYYNPFKYRLYKTSDYQVDAIDATEVYESDEYITTVVKSIIKNYNKNTHNKAFNAMFAVNGIKNVVRYYNKFKELESDLIIGSIFTWNPNEEQGETNSRDDLDMIINDYNNTFKEKHSTDNFNHYRVDFMDKVKRKQIDLVIVSDMLLTGFDAPLLNTLYVDKNLKYHGLIQAFSRTNRLSSAQKDYGNIICFKPIKENVEKAVALFSNNYAYSNVLKEPYETYIEKIKQEWNILIQKFPNPEQISNIVDPEEKIAFVQIFKELNKCIRFAESFTSYDVNDLPFEEYQLIAYKDIYVDMNRKERLNKESILADIDFEMELVLAEKIDYIYIINLLKEVKNNIKITTSDIKAKLDKMDMKYSKKELILEFVEQYLEQRPSGDMEEIFENFNQEYKNKEILKLMDEEGLKEEFVNYVTDLEYYDFEIKEAQVPEFYLAVPPFKERREKFYRIREKILDIFSNINY